MLGVVLLDVPRFTDDRGSLVALETGRPIPFEVRRLFYIWGVAGQASRGADAMSCHEALLAVQGAVTVDLDNGHETKSVRLSRPDQALCIHAGVWLRLRVFTGDAIVLAAASQRHGETRRFDSPQPQLLSAAALHPWDIIDSRLP